MPIFFCGVELLTHGTPNRHYTTVEIVAQMENYTPIFT